MASSGGARAAGTDGRDHAFRQRVDDHYKQMASSKRSLRLAGKMQLASALGLTSTAGTLGALSAFEHTWWLGIAVFTALISAVSSRTANAVGGARQVEKATASYHRWCKTVALLAIGVALVAFGALKGFLPLAAPPQAVLWVGGCVLLLDCAGSALGMRAANSLRDAFRQQQSKAASNAKGKIM